jgi:hypothetical protein
LVACSAWARRLGQRDELADALLEERLDEQLLLREAAIDGAHPHAGVLGDVVHGDGQPALGERLRGRLQDAVAVALGIAPQRARGGGAHGRDDSASGGGDSSLVL